MLQIKLYLSGFYVSGPGYIGSEDGVAQFGSPLFKEEGEVNLNYLPRGSEKLKKRWKYAGGVGLPKKGVALFLFTFFKVRYFYI